MLANSGMENSEVTMIVLLNRHILLVFEH